MRTGHGSVFSGPVAILLPDYLNPDVRLLNAEGLSEVFVSVLASEAFTVAALVDIQSEQAYTSLELDLNQVLLLPAGFYWK
ncbi:hypothetical protein IWX76_000239 [Pedobacter sp. CAN_A7]